jgi:group I intron endonuclease
MPISKKARQNKERIRLEKKQAQKRKKKLNKKTHSEKIKAGIYLIRNKITNRCYYGSSTHIKKRFQIHKQHLNENKHHNKNLQNDWNAYGEETFSFEIIETEMTYVKLKPSDYKKLKERIFQKEKAYIIKNAETCFNIWIDKGVYVSDYLK